MKYKLINRGNLILKYIYGMIILTNRKLFVDCLGLGNNIIFYIYI
jgi:hypothetical protein